MLLKLPMHLLNHLSSGAVGLALLLAGLSAQAASVVTVSPQGEAAQVRQVVMKFNEAVVAFGDLRQPDPAALSCQGGPAGGSARWISDRSWVFDFSQPLGPGVRCLLKLKADWKPLNGVVTGDVEFRFSTGGPAVLQTQPHRGSPVEEGQSFILQLSGPVVEADVTKNAWCEVEGIGERLPLKLVSGAEREALLKNQRLEKLADRTLIVNCGRPLPADARLRLVWGKGIAARGEARVATRVEQRFDFQVRKAFTAEFSCERERANAPCLPIRPLLVRFSEPVSRQQAAQLRLRPASSAAIAPSFDKDDKSNEVQEVRFAGPLAERASFSIELPRELKDASGRLLANASSFPLKVATGDAPPIAKFAAAPFGVIERDAEPMLPLTLRHVQGDLRPQAPAGQVRVRRLSSDAEVLTWLRKLEHFHESQISAKEAGLPPKDWFDVEDGNDANGRPVKRKVERMVATREVSLLKGDKDSQRLDLPRLVGGDPRPFEVVGIPLAQPGYHVVEIESARLGQALLDKAAPMFVRTGVLVTNLGVHFKQGRENSAVWVTTLDRGRPVAGADVAVNDCKGRRLWLGRTDANGLAAIAQRLDVQEAGCTEGSALFVTARKLDDKGGATDMAFVFADWNKGIEPWRFHVATSSEGTPDTRAHTVFDRSLLRAGETVSMKHFVRQETGSGLALPKADAMPTRMKIVHEGSGEEFVQPLAWRGGRSAESSWRIPPSAKLGVYRVELDNPEATGRRRVSFSSGSFRVEEFRVPLLDARLAGPKATVVAPKELPLDVTLSYLSGGGVAQAPVRGSALLRPSPLSFSGFDEFSFAPPRDPKLDEQTEQSEEGTGNGREGRLVADKVAFSTDHQGAGRFTVKNLPQITRASDLLAEVSFSDPNGEMQSVSTTVRMWPSALVPGLKAASWISSRGKARITALALDTAGKPIKGQALEVRGRLTQTISTRKRMVGGFYAYDNRAEIKDLGVLCSGSTDERGLLLCETALDAAGEVELIVSGKDGAGNPAQAATSIWVTRQGELWFSQDNDDRIDVLPEKKRYAPGETARLQVRMPFREATALVAIEREGIVQTRVITLRGDDPSFELKIDKGWAPNIYVSVLALRGRIREVPWYSFFNWGWKAPVEWARAFWYEGREYQAPSAMVDLAKPAFKLGVAQLTVGLAEHELQVSVTPDKTQYAVREKARVRVRVSHGGQPAAGAEVAFAAVDEGLLALRENESWQLLGAMIRPRPWGVVTSTAQSEIIGRRHYGRKAVAAGGGGGKGATRELFDTLLLWRAVVQLDAKGEATIEVPLNDSLTSFRLVAVADAGAQQFGTGSASIRVTQDLQLLSGLPPLVRDGDRFSAMLTLRNTTAREMKVRASLQGQVEGDAANTRMALNFPPQDVVVPAAGAKEVLWPVDVPAEATRITWQAAAQEQGAAPARDRLKLTQTIGAAVPTRVLQATLQQLDGSTSMPVAAPADALPASGAKRGGLTVAVQPRLTGSLPGIRRYFETYPFICLEQKASKAVGLRDKALWATVAAALPTYLDSDGLASYFPPQAADGARGSDRLTAYVLAAAHEAGFELPEGARTRMLDGLTAFVEGRIERKFWSPRADLDVRKLAAIEALSRHGRAQARMLGSINITPQLWPTAALLDWVSTLRRVKGVPDQARRLDEAQQVLRSRLTYAGTTLRFSTEEDDFWWWLMDSPDANAARLILVMLDDPAWKDELPKLVVGSLARQKRGAWLTTTANLWGSLALDKFATKFESARIAGRTLAQIGAAQQVVDWTQSAEGGKVLLPWPDKAAVLSITHEGSGKPWLTVQSLAATPLQAPLRAGYAVTRSITAVEQKDKSTPGHWSRGDVMRIRVEIDAQVDMSWVVLSDPVPGGATVLGSGLGRDSAIATRGERKQGSAWTAYEERGFEAVRSYYEFMPRGKHVFEYSVRLNNPGRFSLPPTRVEAMYAPESFGETPNAAVEVAP